MLHPNQLEISREKLSHLLRLSRLDADIQRVNSGVSTNVYKISRDNTIYYLRIATDLAESMQSEVMIHQLLGSIGVSVPSVESHENFSDVLDGHSYIVTSEIRGAALSTLPSSPREVLFSAGADLAKINMHQLNGFGGVLRFEKDIDEIKGYLTSFEEFVSRDFAKNLESLLSSRLITDTDIPILEYISNQVSLLTPNGLGYLAHGDFSSQHIFADNGEYSGIIDFGDAKVANDVYDLAYFKLQNRDSFNYLTEGYKQQTDIGEDCLFRVSLTALLIGVRVLFYHIEDHKYKGESLHHHPKVISFQKELHEFRSKHF